MITVWLTIRNSRALTLVESLISILLLGTLLVSVLATFVVSNLSASRARHRFTAMNIIKAYIEQEVRAGYDGGSGNEADYYATVTSADAVSVTIDDRGTADTSDDLMGDIRPDPYFPYNIENISHIIIEARVGSMFGGGGIAEAAEPGPPGGTASETTEEDGSAGGGETPSGSGSETTNEDGSGVGGSLISYDGILYKIVGFVVTWFEDVTNQSCSERAVIYVAYHSSA